VAARRTLPLQAADSSPCASPPFSTAPYTWHQQHDGRSANGGAVVPYLLGQRLLGAEWMERLREALQGAGSDDA
jgi:hypothetical protein